MQHLDMFRKGKLGDLLVGSYFRYQEASYRILSRDKNGVRCLAVRNMRPVPYAMSTDLEVLY